ncbi:hypothetical protein HRbin02_01718 [Candidatus Calditenuaceae archaeon HR02]|nr:hypothetical protein HRbin02_01718 [Candidatus Calditenuaceae archaeon HR02]
MPQGAARIEQLVSHVRVRLTRDIARLRVGGRELADLRQGSQVTLPIWAMEKLWELGLAEPVGGVIDLSKMTQILWRERRSPAELVELPENFYYNVIYALSSLRQKDPESHKTLLQAYRDIVSLRMAKLLAFALRGLDPSLIRNMVEEERELYLWVKGAVDSWIESIGLGVR